MTFDVFGIGNALVDIQAQVSDDQLQAAGFEKGIMTLVDDEQQCALLQSLDGVPLNRCAGGSAANTVIAIANLGGRAAYAGKVSRDETGQFFLDDMQKQGVTIEVPPATAGQTGTSTILITNDAQRTMLTNLAVSGTLTKADVDEKLIARSKYLYIEGYLLTSETPKTAAYRAIEVAKAHNVRIALTASDPFLVNMLRDEIMSLIEGPVDLLFCNEEEARSLTQMDEPAECAREIHRHTENVALTLGANGSLLMHKGELIPIEGVAVDAIDTTGAGDMFAGALLYGITNGLTWKDAGHLASRAAARIVSQLGARMEHGRQTFG